MPYITRERRNALCFERPKNAGELNYRLTRTVLDYINEKGLSYQTINDIVGALESAKLEFYRRTAAPYEDQKISTNGDVY